jgi:hypothetical protein
MCMSNTNNDPMKTNLTPKSARSINPPRGSMVFSKVLLVLAIVSFLASCEIEDLSQPGLAFVSFTWVQTEPLYIEIENDYIPEVFYWDWYYRVSPGIYHVYYEGTYVRNGKNHAYAWELEYEVWENAPEKRKNPWETVPDGPDAYFTVELAPNGPVVLYEEVFPVKSVAIEESASSDANFSNEIIIEKSSRNYSLRLKYKKVLPSK